MSVEMKNNLSLWKLKDHYRWYRIDKKICFFFRKIKWMFQRAERGYCDRDIWNLDYTLGSYIAATVIRLAETTHGYPGTITEKEWDEILRDIAEKFYVGVNEDCWENPYEDEVDQLIDSARSESEVWSKWLEKDKEIAAAMERSRNEGFEKLIEWFPHLWD